MRIYIVESNDVSRYNIDTLSNLIANKIHNMISQSIIKRGIIKNNKLNNIESLAENK